MNKMEHILDTISHKKYILQVGEVVVKNLIKTNREELAFELGKRLISHDNSKISDEEINNFIKIEKRGDMKNPDIVIDEELKKNIEIHWKNNRHHPEHFSDYHNMTEVDIWEMCCDWFSRSLQNNTDFLPFVEKRQKNRFQFDESFYKRIYECCLQIQNWNAHSLN